MRRVEKILAECAVLLFAGLAPTMAQSGTVVAKDATVDGLKLHYLTRAALIATEEHDRIVALAYRVNGVRPPLNVGPADSDEWLLPRCPCRSRRPKLRRLRADQQQRPPCLENA